MQPYALTHSFPPSHNHFLHSSAQKADLTKRVKRRKQAAADQDATEEELDNVHLNTPRARPRGDYYRRRDSDQLGDNSRHRKRAQKKGGVTLADARAEHVLLAARKVGRERASILAGSFHAAGRDKDKDLKNDPDQVDPTPKTPRKHRTVGVGNGSSTSVIYLNSPIPATADTASVEQVSSDFSPAQTPLTSRKSARSQVTHGRVARMNPLTPLDSLLTAASTISMIEEKEDEDEDEDADGECDVGPDPTPGVPSKPSTRQMPRASFGNPAPTKRRRLASAKPARSLPSLSASDHKDPSERLGTARSALDVLADQAAVFGSQDHDSTSAKDRGKGKGKAKAFDITSSLDEGAHPVGEPARQTSHARDQAPHQRSHQPSTSASSAPSQSMPVTARGHDPPTTTSANATERSSKNARSRNSTSPAHLTSAVTSRRTSTTRLKEARDISSADPPRTDDKEAI